MIRQVFGKWTQIIVLKWVYAIYVFIHSSLYAHTVTRDKRRENYQKAATGIGAAAAAATPPPAPTIGEQ